MCIVFDYFRLLGYSVEIDEEATIEWYKNYEGRGSDCEQETYPFAALGFPEPHFDLMFYMEIPWVSEEPKDK
ncbi:MAG: hypothetical protein LUC92_04865 [Clostridiales bacterium]|nr:hypothetical protein [Clostridiales bacterium]